jgi:predicted nuclease of predicted toxin-antitoxin system
VIIWVDAQLSPALAPWITQQFGIEAFSVKRLGMVNSNDLLIFEAARSANAVVLTKDADFGLLLDRFGPPPQVLWIRCGNTSKAHVQRILTATLPSAVRLLQGGEPLVEINDTPQ